MFFVDNKNNPIQFPEEINLKLKKALFGKTEIENKDFKSEKVQLEKLWKILALDRGIQKENHYGFDSKLVRTYASYYLPINVLKPALILEEMSLLNLKLQLHHNIRWLDMGTGPGTLLWGIKWWFEQHAYSHELQFLGLDQSKNFVNLAQELESQVSFDLKCSRQFKTIKSKKDIIKEIETFKPTVLSAMNSLAEIEPDIEKRKEFIQEILETFTKHSPNGLGLLIEPGSKKNSRELLEIREWIRQKYTIWLPCLSDRECGAYKDTKDWCHELVDCEFPGWVNELGKGANLQKDSVLFSYLVFTSGEFFKVQKFPAQAHRMVSDRIQEKGLMKCFFCTNEGTKKIIRLIHSRANDQNKKFLEIVRGDILTESIVDEKSNIESFEKIESKTKLF